MPSNPELVRQWRQRLNESRYALAQPDADWSSGSSANLRLYRYLVSNYGAGSAAETPPTETQTLAAAKRPAVSAASSINAGRVDTTFPELAALGRRTPPKSHTTIRAALKSVHAANAELRLPMHLWLRYARTDEQWLVVATTRRNWALDRCWDTLQRCGISARKVRRRTEIVLEVSLPDFVEAARILKQQRHSLRSGHSPDLLAHPALVLGVSAIYGGVIGGAAVVLLDMLRASFFDSGAMLGGVGITAVGFPAVGFPAVGFPAVGFPLLVVLGWAIGALAGLGLGWRSVKKAEPRAGLLE